MQYVQPLHWFSSICFLQPYMHPAIFLARFTVIWTLYPSVLSTALTQIAVTSSWVYNIRYFTYFSFVSNLLLISCLYTHLTLNCIVQFAVQFTALEVCGKNVVFLCNPAILPLYNHFSDCFFFNFPHQSTPRFLRNCHFSQHLYFNISCFLCISSMHYTNSGYIPSYSHLALLFIKWYPKTFFQSALQFQNNFFIVFCDFWAVLCLDVHIHHGYVHKCHS